MIFSSILFNIVTKSEIFFPDSSQMAITDFTVLASLKLVEMLIERLSLRKNLVIICLAIKLFFLNIQKWGNGGEDKPEEWESVKKGTTGQLLKKLENKLRGEFCYHMHEYYQREPLLRELQVRFESIVG